MTTEEWDPTSAEAETNYTIDHDLLERILGQADAKGLDNIADFLSTEEKATHKLIMSQNKSAWITAGSAFDDEQLIKLIEFFTLAEMEYPNWEAGEKSPVIGLAKLLRQRGKSLEKAQLQWIKSKNPNKFLPFGAL